MILGLFTELLSAGGVQRVGCHTAAVLAEIARREGVECRVLSLNDPAGAAEIRVGELGARAEGFGRRKDRLLAAVLRLAPRVSRAYLGHPSLAPLGLALRARNRASRFWVHLHGVEAWERLPFAPRLGLRFATGVVAISRYTADRAAAVQGIAPAKIRVIPNALDPAVRGGRGGADSGDADGGGAGTPERRSAAGGVLLTVARLAAAEGYKGVDAVIRALPTVLAAVPGAAYVVVGDGDDRPRLERLASELGVASHVRFLGRVSDEQLRHCYCSADVFVMPSTGEGFGVVFLEAMTFGKPVVAAARGGAPEVVVDGTTGFLVDHESVPVLAERLVRLLTDDALRARLGEAGRRRVHEQFTFEHFRDRLARVVADGAASLATDLR